jgi:ATP-binding cassette subfamily B (MDR/TAP) protein 1
MEIYAHTCIQEFSTARTCAFQILQTLKRMTLETETSEDQNGVQPLEVKGHVQLTNVSFCYPSRPKACILKSMSIDLKPGTTNALVGPSGSGKSTIVQLILRFYEPSGGSLALDGVDMSMLSTGFIRRHIGLVSQEPVLFATTIMENIRYVCMQVCIYVCMYMIIETIRYDVCMYVCICKKAYRPRVASRCFLRQVSCTT